ncbi:DUF421 domain-containing protein [Litchfieldia salsa]|uniref:DUF421 domain-containing protein n=1 Tax=Litchfieldia salsa TaxID=930152 RepID=UPI00111391A3
MEMVKDILLVQGRIITIIPLLLIITLIVGKRSIGELPVFDFIIIITLGSLVGADIADPSVDHIPTAAAVITIGILQRIIQGTSIKYRKFGQLITFEPTIVIRDGFFLVKNMKKIRYSVDNVLTMLRENGVFDTEDVALAIIEANGNLTVQKKPMKTNVTIEDLKLNKLKSGIAYPVLVEGRIYSSILEKLNLDNEWLIAQLQRKGLQVEDIFFASVTADNKLHISLIDYPNDLQPTILH